MSQSDNQKQEQNQPYKPELKSYHKLVRDRIPEIIRASGRQCGIEIITDEFAYRQALLEKLVEEAQEALVAGHQAEEDLLQELADLLEVVDALLKAYHFSPDQLHQLQTERRNQRGSFDNRLRLLWTQSI
jgi:predicted house-cleaning noncanonical NTP pyrophosphatase (MazG superfamily)